MTSGSKLTEDEKEFLRGTGAYHREVRARNEREMSRAPRRPRLPVKTMIAVVVIGVVLTLVVTNIISSLQPYAELMNTDEWEQVSSGNTDDPTLNGISTMGAVYGYRSWAYVAVIVVIALIEALLALQWLLRNNRWERKRTYGNRRKDEKKPDSGRDRHNRGGHRGGGGGRHHPEGVRVVGRRE